MHSVLLFQNISPDEILNAMSGPFFGMDPCIDLYWPVFPDILNNDQDLNILHGIIPGSYTYFLNMHPDPSPNPTTHEHFVCCLTIP